MGIPQTKTPSPSTHTHLYSQTLQLKLYQAFIFSIPILFTIVLLLLFYLFYLKRRTTPSPSQTLPITRLTNQYVSFDLPSVCNHVGFQEQLHHLRTVLFNEDLRSKDSQCCVCLGEFEIKEELLQISSCEHVFHSNCICLWLQSNCTCPLCRCCIIPIPKLHNPDPFSELALGQHEHATSSQGLEISSAERQQEQQIQEQQVQLVDALVSSRQELVIH